MDSSMIKFIIVVSFSLGPTIIFFLYLLFNKTSSNKTKSIPGKSLQYIIIENPDDSIILGRTN